MIITVRTRTPATDAVVVREVSRLFDRRAALEHPPASLTVSDAVALGIATLFRNPSRSGQVLDHFVTRGIIDSDELVDAARFEQGFASPEGYAALRCLILWVRGRTHRQGQRAAGASR